MTQCNSVCFNFLASKCTQNRQIQWMCILLFVALHRLRTASCWLTRWQKLKECSKLSHASTSMQLVILLCWWHVWACTKCSVVTSAQCTCSQCSVVTSAQCTCSQCRPWSLRREISTISCMMCETKRDAGCYYLWASSKLSLIPLSTTYSKSTWRGCDFALSLGNRSFKAPIKVARGHFRLTGTICFLTYNEQADTKG